MAELMRDWILGVSAAAIALAVAQSLVPQGGVRRVCLLAGGVALMLAVLQPLVQLDGEFLADAAAVYQEDMEAAGAALEERSRQVYFSVIEAQTAAYVVDKAAELGISCCQAEVTVHAEKDGVPIPWTVSAWAEWEPGQREALAEVLERDLGIPRERQSLLDEGA